MTFQDFWIVVVIIIMLLGFQLRKTLLSWKMKKRVRKSKKAEHKAKKILEQAGYTILETQKRRPIITYLDGKPFKNWLQVDCMVQKSGKTFVVEVKTGTEATKITNSATRRQLLEYYFTYRPDGILLVDMEYGKIQEVKFQEQADLKLKYLSILYISVGLALGILVSYFYFKGGSLFE